MVYEFHTIRQLSRTVHGAWPLHTRLDAKVPVLYRLRRKRYPIHAPAPPAMVFHTARGYPIYLRAAFYPLLSSRCRLHVLCAQAYAALPDHRWLKSEFHQHRIRTPYWTDQAEKQTLPMHQEVAIQQWMYLPFHASPAGFETAMEALDFVCNLLWVTIIQDRSP